MKNTVDFIGIKDAARQLAQKTEADKNFFLSCLAAVLEKNKAAILKANQQDIRAARKQHLSEAFIQRLVLDEKGIVGIEKKLESLQKLKSGIGNVRELTKLDNGIILKKVSVPLGVILVIYEARPEVTIEVAALCIKSGNVALLKGGSEALHTNQALYKCILEALEIAKMSPQTVSFIEDRSDVRFLLQQTENIDLVIARGGYNMVKSITNQSRIPVLAHSSGGARIYIDKSADLSMACDIVINAKISKPAACNSLDTVLIHKDTADSFIIELVKHFQGKKVTVLGDNYISNIADIEKTTDWDTEYLGLTVSFKRVESCEEAISFITNHSKKHSEGIIAQDTKVINQFTKAIDAAALFINCSTRFHDGYEFGLGAEMGIATGKLHARGPVGLRELTTYKWEAYGNGQIR